MPPRTSWPWPFIVAGALGLIASIVVHLSTVIGVPNPLGRAAWALHAGVFVVWFPAVLVGIRLSRDFKNKDLWRAALRGCPPWLTYAAGAFFVYALINFALFMLTSVHGKPTESQELRGFSGHWMAFYAVGIAMLYSSTRAEEFDRSRRCYNGHVVSPLARFCEECGAPVRSQVAYPARAWDSPARRR